MKIAVVGSINIDMVYHLKEHLKIGETVFVDGYQVLDGGKGANQAVMLAALNDEVVMLGCVGDDAFGRRAISNLHEKNVCTEYIQIKKGYTGLAIIQVVNGDNSIVVVPGENLHLEKKEIDDFLNKNSDIEILVCQLEINFDAIEYLINECSKRNIKVVLNPAPALKLNQGLIDKVSYLIPNETEFSVIFPSRDMYDAVEFYKGKLVVTLGSQGVLFYNGEKAEIVPAEKINVVDTTGAGDSFVAGFTTGIIRKYSLKEAVQLGIKVASITCQVLGAQSAHKIVKEVLEK